MGSRLESTIAIVNGLVGDFLAETGNGLATPLTCVAEGRRLPVEREALERAYPAATPRVVLLVHGLMCTESVWRRPGAGQRRRCADYGSLLADELGYTPLYLRYNSGRAIADNGAALAALLESLDEVYPVAIGELLLIGHSLGGLVIRSACELARTRSSAWLAKVRRTISIGTPHEGSPFERVGRSTTSLLRAARGPFTRLAADLGDLRSAAIKDLGDADLRHRDQSRRRPGRRSRGWRHPVPFADGIAHLQIAGTAASRPSLAAAAGDFLVPVASATARGSDLPAECARVVFDIGHLELARHPAVYDQIRSWCEPGA